MSTNWLSAAAFSAACAALPLVSLDLCLTRPAALPLVSLDFCLTRSGTAGPELLLGLPASTLPRVHLPHWLDLSAAEAASLMLPQGPDQQHARWQWLPLDQAARDEPVHPYVRVYAQWLRDNARLCD